LIAAARLAPSTDQHNERSGRTSAGGDCAHIGPASASRQPQLLGHVRKGELLKTPIANGSRRQPSRILKIKTARSASSLLAAGQRVPLGGRSAPSARRSVSRSNSVMVLRRRPSRGIRSAFFQQRPPPCHRPPAAPHAGAGAKLRHRRRARLLRLAVARSRRSMPAIISSSSSSSFHRLARPAAPTSGQAASRAAAASPPRSGPARFWMVICFLQAGSLLAGRPRAAMPFKSRSSCTTSWFPAGNRGQPLDREPARQVVCDATSSLSP